MPPLTLPPWCHEIPRVKTWKGETFRRVEEKLDGWAVACVVEEHPTRGKKIKVLTTGLDDVSHHVNHRDWFSKIAQLPPRTVVVGEIVAADRNMHPLPASEVPTALRNGQILFYAYGLPAFAGKPVHTFDETDSLLTALNILQARKIHVPARERTPVSPSEMPSYLDLFYDAARQAGAEGVVLKSSPYDDWFKVKVERTVDAFILGFKAGTGRNKDNVGSLVVGVYDDAGQVVEIAAASGLSDVVRARLANQDDRDRLLDAVVEVRYQYVGAKGRLRHPRFARFREDKRPDQCLHSQLKEAHS